MRSISFVWLVIVLTLGAVSVQAADRYVAQNGQTPASPFTAWSSAASNIQDAINAAVNDDNVWVGAGVYLKPTNAVVFEGTNVVYINKRLSLRGVSGAANTIIDGEGANRGIAWNYTPVSITNRFLLDGFTIRYGFATNRGAGVYVTPGIWTGVVQNCVICSNTVAGTNTPSGGGFYDFNTAAAFSITFTNCLIQGNVVTNSLLGSDSQGGGVWLRNTGLQLFQDCTIEDNRAGAQGGGIYALHSTLTLERCIVRNNRAPISLNAGSGGGGLYLQGNLFARNCLLYGNMAAGAGGAIASQTRGSNSFINVDNCTIVSNSSGVYIRDQGVAQNYMPSLHIVNSIVYSNVTDISLGASGELPANYSSYASNCCLGSTNSGVMFGTTNLLYYAGLSANNIVSPPQFVDFRSANFRLWPWSPAVDTGLTEPWMTGVTDLAGQPRVSVNGLADMGCYETTAEPRPLEFYAAQNGQTPVPPYTNWVTAASNIQDAIGMAVDGDTVWIGAGRYRGPGSGLSYNNVTNIVTLNKPLALRGAGATRGDVLIDGEGAYRGIHVAYAATTTNRFVISGLTVTNSSDRGILFQAATAGVIWTGVVDNCAVVNNRNGGINDDVASPNTSARTIIITNTLVRGNAGSGITISFAAGGTFSSVIADSIVEQNTNSGVSLNSGTHTLSRCIVRDNSGASGAGLSLGVGTYSMDNCLVARNTAAGIGGGIYKSSSVGPISIYNCTIVSNLSTATGPGGIRSGASNSMVNCVIYSNFFGASSAAGDNIFSYSLTTLTNCLAPGYTGSGNLSAPPFFQDFAGGDYRLKRYSPGVDAGLVLAGMATATDLTGQPRVSGNGLVDMGAYETTYEAYPSYYVAQNGQTPMAPYTNLTMAASNIQDAVDAVNTNIQTVVLVYPGRYTVPSTPTNYLGTNIVFINRPMTLRGVSGNPDDTIIDGQGLYRGIAVAFHQDDTRRFIFENLTITNCYATTIGAGIWLDCLISGGYAWTSVVQNCRFMNNLVVYGPGTTNPASSSFGGVPEGAWGGGIGAHNRAATMGLIISNSVFSRNVSTNYIGESTNSALGSGGNGGGLYFYSQGQLLVSGCRFRNNRGYRGGGAIIGGAFATIENSEISGGLAGSYGSQGKAGGFFHTGSAIYRNCLMFGNTTGSGGSGAAINEEMQQSNGVVEVYNCTIVSNYGGGVYIRAWARTQNFFPSLHLVNSIVYSNTTDILLGAGADGPPDNYSSYASNSCIGSTNSGFMYGTTNLLYFKGLSANTFTNNPRFANFAAGNYRARFDSPCINAGLNQGWMTGALDFDGNPRISPMNTGTVDIGAYEYPIQIGSVFNLR